MLKLPFDRRIVDRKFFFAVEKHQRVNFEKQVNSSLEQGVSENHLLFRQESLQRCVRKLGPTLKLLCKRKGLQKERKPRPKSMSMSTKVSSPVKNVSLNSFKRSFADMKDLVTQVDEELSMKKRLREELRESKELENTVPLHVQTFLKSDPVAAALLLTPGSTIESIKDDPMVKMLASFHRWTQSE